MPSPRPMHCGASSSSVSRGRPTASRTTKNSCVVGCGSNPSPSACAAGPLRCGAPDGIADGGTGQGGPDGPGRLRRGIGSTLRQANCFSGFRSCSQMISTSPVGRGSVRCFHSMMEVAPTTERAPGEGWRATSFETTTSCWSGHGREPIERRHYTAKYWWNTGSIPGRPGMLRGQG
jgi:hypothetical protein